MNRFYNIDAKEEFIENSKEGYREPYKYFFEKTYFLELKQKKDLYNFNIEELAQLMARLKCSTKKAAGFRYFLIFRYIDYYREFRDDKINPLSLESTKWARQFVDTESKVLLSCQEYEDVLSKCINPQDAVIFQLLFEGISGYKYSEILNLKLEDIGWDNNILTISDDRKGKREVEVSSYCIELIKKAIEQKEYHDQNGKSKAKNSIQSLVDNNYIVRCVSRRAKHVGKADRHLVHRRVDEVFKAFYPSIKPKSIVKSGMIKFAVDLSLKLQIPVEDFNNEHMDIISCQFNRKVNTSTYSVIKRDILDHVEDLYGDLSELQLKDFELVSDGETEVVKVAKKNRIAPFSFRQDILLAYGKCAITREKFHNVLEACHIEPYINEKSNHIQNGILLRSDFHKLFDDGFITITDDYRVTISPLIKSEYYQSFNGIKLLVPDNSSYYPSLKALEIHRQIFGI